MFDNFKEKEIFENLDKEIEKSGLSTKEISKLVGYNQSTISKHRNGKINFNIESLTIYSDALGISITNFLPPPPPIRIIGKIRECEYGQLDKVRVYDEDDIQLYLFLVDTLEMRVLPVY